METLKAILGWKFAVGEYAPSAAAKTFSVLSWVALGLMVLSWVWMGMSL